MMIHDDTKSFLNNNEFNDRIGEVKKLTLLRKQQLLSRVWPTSLMAGQKRKF